METVRDSWTDERLDDLSRRMELGFAEVKTELKREIGSVREELRSEIGSVRSEIGSVREELRDEIGSVRSAIGAVQHELHAMQRTMIHFYGAVILALLGLIVTQF